MSFKELFFGFLIIDSIVLSFLTHFMVKLDGSIDGDTFLSTIIITSALIIIEMLVIAYKGSRTKNSIKLIMEAFFNPIFLFFLSFAFFNIIISFLCRWISADCRHYSEKYVSFSCSTSFIMSFIVTSFILGCFHSNKKDSNNKKEELNNQKDNQDKLEEEQGNVESEKKEYLSDYDEGGNTEYSSEQSYFSKTETNSNIKYEKQPEIDGKTNDKDIKQIGFDNRYEKIKQEEVEEGRLNGKKED